MTFAFPLVIISIFRVFGTIRSFTMEERRDRIPVFFFVAIIYGFVTYLLFSKSRISVDDSLFKLFLIVDCLILASAIITIFYKVSVHSMGLMGVLGILLPLNKIAENNSLVIPSIVILLIAGVVMSARLQLNAHTPREVLVGTATGFSIGFFGMILLF
jgi:membrane-associated phospholipid phosphatase